MLSVTFGRDERTVRRLAAPGRRRLHPTPGDLDEQLLVEADASGRERARRGLMTAFRGFDLASIDATADRGTVAFFDVDLEFLRRLDARRVVDDDTLTSDLVPPRLRLANGILPAPLPDEMGVIVPPTIAGDAHTVRPFSAWQVVNEGTTLILNSVASRGTGPLRDLSNDVGRVTATRPRINAYISERDAPGFGRHWDDHDVVIIQCEGRKYWEVFEPAVLSPMLGFVDPGAFGERAFSVVLEPGMGLYIPRGWGHQVRGFQDELSLHMTLGLRRMSGVDLVRGLVDLDPMVGAEALGSDGDVDISAFGALARDAAAVENVYGHWRARSIAMFHVGQLDIWTAEAAAFDGWSVYAPAIGGLVLADGGDLEADEVGVAVAGHVLGIGRAWVPLLAALLEGRRLTVAECRALVPGATLDACRRWIVQMGLAEFATVCRTETVDEERSA